MLYKDSYWLFQSTTLTFSTLPFLHLHRNFVLFSFIVLVAFVNFKETNMMMMTSYLCNEHIHMASSKRHCFYIISFVCMCVVSVEVRNWKPIPIDSITDDFSATVEQILGSLASFITIRIRLTRWIITHFALGPWFKKFIWNHCPGSVLWNSRYYFVGTPSRIFSLPLQVKLWRKLGITNRCYYCTPSKLFTYVKLQFFHLYCDI